MDQNNKTIFFTQITKKEIFKGKLGSVFSFLLVLSHEKKTSTSTAGKAILVFLINYSIMKCRLYFVVSVLISQFLMITDKEGCSLFSYFFISFLYRKIKPTNFPTQEIIFLHKFLRSKSRKKKKKTKKKFTFGIENPIKYINQKVLVPSTQVEGE